MTCKAKTTEAIKEAGDRRQRAQVNMEEAQESKYVLSVNSGENEMAGWNYNHAGSGN